MTTMAATVADLRRVLKDRPERTKITADIVDTTTETFTVTKPELFAVGNVWEHDDGGASGAERRYVTAVNTASSTVTAERGFQSSTAATHSSTSIVLKDPRFPYDECALAVNLILNLELYNAGIYDIKPHQVTASATTNWYDSPSSGCEEFLRVYQQITASEGIVPITNFTPLGRDVDTSLYASGRAFSIVGGASGTTYYVNCKHKLTITTLTESQKAIVLFLGAAHLLEWEEPRQTAGPTNQGDRSVKPGTHAQMAAYYRAQAAGLIAKERAYLKALNPPRRVYLKEKGY
jgi:hypothetical protein